LGLIFITILLVTPVYAQSFTEALAEAYETNPDLNAARAALRGADEQVPQALSHWRPTVNATAQQSQEGIYSHQSPFGTVASTGTGSDLGVVPSGHQTLQPYSYGLQITQPVYRGGRTEADTSRAENTVLAQRAQLANTEQTVFLNAGTAYLDVVRDQTVSDLQISNEKILHQTVEAFQHRLEAGDVTKTDISQSRAQAAQTRAARALAASQLSASRAKFLRYIGSYPEKLEQPTLPYPLPATVEEATDEAENQNPQVLNALYTESAARDAIDLANGSRLPEINIVGETGRLRQGYTGSTITSDATVEIQLNMPLYTGGLTSSQVRQAQQLASQRMIEIETAKREAHENALAAWQNLEAISDAVKEQQAAVTEAEEAYKGAKIEDAAGTKTTLDLLSTLQVLLTAQTSLATEEHDLLLAKLNLLSATGGLTAERLALPVTYYDPKSNYEAVHDKWMGTDAEMVSENGKQQ
jgi:TolC family type I secretion outer membrane protein